MTRRLALVVAGAVAAAAVGALVFALVYGPEGAGAPAPAAPVTVATSVAPRPSAFGDRVTARAEILVDRGRVDPGQVEVEAEFAPYSLVGPPLRSSSEAGSVTALGYRYTLSCLSEACLPPAGAPRLVRLPRLRVRAPLRAGGTAVVSAAWPAVAVEPRVTAADVAAAPPPWRLQLAFPPASYRFDPGRLSTVLTAVAVALAAAALALVGWEIVRRRRMLREQARARSALARALELARESAGRPTDDRRKALGELAHLLAAEDNGDRRLTVAAARLAWGRQQPSPAAIDELVGEIERTAGKRR
jgi:hypothetical protein